MSLPWRDILVEAKELPYLFFSVTSSSYFSLPTASSRLPIIIFDIREGLLAAYSMRVSMASSLKLFRYSDFQ